MSRDMKLAALSVAIGATLAVAAAIFAYYVLRVTP